MMINFRQRTCPALFIAGVLSLLGLLILPIPARQDTRAERLRLQKEEDRLSKEIAELEGNLRGLKQYERYIIKLTDPNMILTVVSMNLKDFGIPTKFSDRTDSPSLDEEPVPISEGQLNQLVLVIALDMLLRGSGKVRISEITEKDQDLIKNKLLLKSKKIQHDLEKDTLRTIIQKTAHILQDIEGYTEERERVRADFARLTGQPGAAGESRTYDDKGKSVYVSCGERAFANECVGRTAGVPGPKAGSGTDPAGALKRDYNGAKDTGYYTLGCRGSITLRFSQIYLVDGPGADLYIFEVGPDVEGTKLEIKTENGPWIPVGEIGGGAVQVDIHDALASRGLLNQRFSQVKLTDLGQKCAGNWPGADIDAIAALHCVLR